MTRNRLIVYCVSLALVLAAAYGLQTRQIYVSSGELAHVFTDLHELSVEANLIVFGTFTDRTKFVDTPWNKESKVKIVLHEFKPIRMVKGSLDQPVWVGVYGMKQYDKWIGAVNQALYTPGSTYVLFLQESIAEFGPGLHFYWTVGAYQGSFRVRDGKVWARSELGESDSTKVTATGQDLESFLGRLKDQ